MGKATSPGKFCVVAADGAKELTGIEGQQEDVKKLKNWCGEISALKKVAPGCPVNDRWAVGIHFASA